jgi:hypothetical protein
MYIWIFFINFKERKYSQNTDIFNFESNVYLILLMQTTGTPIFRSSTTELSILNHLGYNLLMLKVFPIKDFRTKKIIIP